MGTINPLGVMPDGDVRAVGQRVSKSIIEGFEAIADLTGTISDVLDELGVVGVVGASKLRPTIPGSRVIGTALTLRHDPLSSAPLIGAQAHHSTMAEIEAHNVAEPGDVLVIQGVDDVSGIGGISATIGKRQGEIGAVVDGGIRDIDFQRKLPYPIWSTSITPQTGKWRVATTAVNVPVRIQGLMVNPGDLIVADDTGVCVVPSALAEEVLRRCQEVAAKEDDVHVRIAAGASMIELAVDLNGVDPVSEIAE